MNLDEHYDTSRPVADGNVAPYLERFVEASASARTAIESDLGRRYGAHERETVDFFPALREGAPLFVWVHGGYWRRMSKDAFSFVAPPLVAAGAAVAVINYPLAPGPTLDDIVGSVRRAHGYVLEHAADLRADATSVVAGGHSVGAQLAAMIAARYPCKGLVGLSGLYDLEPLRSTYVNDTIAMDPATALRNAPIHNPPLGNPTLLVSAGEREQAAFHEQQRLYLETWRAWGHPARELAAPDHDHFSIVLELARPESPLTRAVAELVFA